MNRTLTVAVVAALALPIVALAALIGQQEIRFANALTVNVPVRGYDPRDLLRGHYITGQFDWNWETAPGTNGAGGLCVLSSSAGTRPNVRFIANWRAGEGAQGCKLVIAGRVVSSAFVPATLDNGTRGIRLYVSETRAPELEELMRKHPGALTVDLAVRADGSAAIMALRVDGQIVGR